MSGPGQQQFNPGEEQLDPELKAEFEELLGSITKSSVKKVLARNKEKLVRKAVVNEEALQGSTKQELLAYGLLEGDAAVLKLAFPTPPTAGAGASGVALAGAGGSGSYGSVTIHVTRDALEKLGKAPGLEFDRDQVQLRAPGNLHVGRLAEDRNIKVLEYCVTTSDAVPSAEDLKDKQPGTDNMIPVQPGQHVWLRCKRPGHNWLLNLLLGPVPSTH